MHIAGQHRLCVSKGVHDPNSCGAGTHRKKPAKQRHPACHPCVSNDPQGQATGIGAGDGGRTHCTRPQGNALGGGAGTCHTQIHGCLPQAGIIKVNTVLAQISPLQYQCLLPQSPDGVGLGGLAMGGGKRLRNRALTLAGGCGVENIAPTVLSQRGIRWPEEWHQRGLCEHHARQYIY